MMHAFFHDWQILFEQIDQVSFHDRAEAQASQNKPRDFDALPVTPGTADNDRNVKHGPMFGVRRQGIKYRGATSVLLGLLIHGMVHRWNEMKRQKVSLLGN